MKSYEMQNFSLTVQMPLDFFFSMPLFQTIISVVFEKSISSGTQETRVYRIFHKQLSLKF